MTSARRGEGVSQNWTIVREVAWIRYYESIPNVDRGTLRRSGTKNWKFVDVICTSPLTCFATLFRETESLLKRHKHSSATSNDYRETWLITRNLAAHDLHHEELCIPLFSTQTVLNFQIESSVTFLRGSWRPIRRRVDWWVQETILELKESSCSKASTG